MDNQQTQSQNQNQQCIKVPPNNSSSNNNKNGGDNDDGSDSSSKIDPHKGLIITSVKRAGGMYECDYCRTDISQVPRITCAICVEFDICLECFTQVNHDLKHVNSSNYDRILKGDLMLSDADGGDGGGGGELVFDETTLLPVRKENQHFQPQEPQPQEQHDASHGYKVADSTRYFMFPSLRGVTIEEKKKEKVEDKNKDKNEKKEESVNQDDSKKSESGESGKNDGSNSNENINKSETKETKENNKQENNDKHQSVKDDDDNDEPQKKRIKIESDEHTSGDHEFDQKIENTIETDQENKMDVDGSDTQKSDSVPDTAADDDADAVAASNTINPTAKDDKMDVDGVDADSATQASVSATATATSTDYTATEPPTSTTTIDATASHTVAEETAAINDKVTANDQIDKVVDKKDEKDEKDDKVDKETTVANENNDDNTAAKDAPLSDEDQKDKPNNVSNADIKEKIDFEKGEEKNEMVQQSGDNDVEMNDVSNGSHAETTSKSESAPAANDQTKEAKEESGPQEDQVLEKKDISTAAVPTENSTEKKASSIDSSTSEEKSEEPDSYLVTDDARYMWTVEEDLRLIEAISTFGLGNWADISEEVSGMSSTNTNKTPKRCMERYLDDYCGRYGHILPEYTLVQVQNNNENNDEKMPDVEKQKDGLVNNTRKRLRSNTGNEESQEMSTFKSNGKVYRVIKTSSLPGYEKIWPDPYLPPLPNLKIGDDVGRDHAVRCEQTYMKEVSSASNSVDAKSIRNEWSKLLNKPGGPRVLPPRTDDVKKLPGAELAGFMPRRGDFDVEWDNDADKLLEDMEFSSNDTPEEREIKIKVIEIYNSKLDEREKRKKFLIEHDLLDYRKKQREDRKLPADERDLVNRMRLFARFHSAEEHKKLIDELLKAKRLRKEIARLQMYRRMGFKSLLDVERFELDRNRKEFHRNACRMREKEQEEEQQAAAKAAGDLGASGTSFVADEKGTYHRQYKSSDRKIRRSINRSQNDPSDIKGDMTKADVTNSAPDNDTSHTPAVEQQQEKSSDSNSTALTKDSTALTTVAATVAATTKQAPSSQKFDVKNCEGIELLSSKEVQFCQRLELEPKLYLQAKRALIEDSLKKGILDDETKSSHRSVVKIDVKSQGDIVKFVLQAGWIPSEPRVDGERNSKEKS